ATRVSTDCRCGPRGAHFTSVGQVGVRAIGTAVRMRESLAHLREMGVLLYEPLHITMLANAEGECGRLGEGLAMLDAQLAVIERTGQHWFDAEVHRARGEIQLKRDPANPAPAEEAFLTAIAVAKQQATRS